MDLSSGDISAMVFRRVSRDDLGQIALDGHMLNVLMELDGAKSVSVISKKIGFTMSSMRVTISKLLDLKLIEPAEDAVTTLNKDFFDYLDGQLSLAIGPIARVIIEDTVRLFGQGLSKFPSYRAAELVDMLSQEISREDKRVTFQRAMLEKIKEIKP